MGFRRARIEKEGLTKEDYKETANMTPKEIENSKTKNFNLRLSKEELDLLKKEAAKNRRSMQQHMKHLLWSSFEPQKEPEQT